MKQPLKSKSAKSLNEEKSPKSDSDRPKVLPHRYKTQMCKAYEKGLKCEFGQACNFAHGEK